MMNIKYFFRGYVKYLIKSDNPYRLINKLKTIVPLRDIKFPKDNYITFMTFYNYKSDVDETAHSFGDEIVKRKCRGVPHLFNKYKNRLGLFVGFIFSVFLVILSTFYVWKIEVEGNENVSDEKIKAVLSEVGFNVGMRKNSVNINSIINKYLIADDLVSWLSINFEGTVAHVEVKEARLKKPVEKKQNVNIVSDADGVIVRVDALSGQSVVYSGDVVTKGQLLVSAFVDKRTGGSMLRGAKGFVWAKTSRSYTAVVPLNYKQKRYTGKNINKYIISCFNKEVVFGMNYKGFTDAELTNTSIVSSDRLPFKINCKSLREYVSFQKRRTNDEALSLARSICDTRLENATDNYTLIDKTEKYYVEDDCLIYVCSYDGVENIGRELEFSAQ